MSTPLRSRLISTWAVLLAGPVVGTIYFFVVYLLAEVSCADGLDLVGTTTLRVVILVGAAASVGVFVVYAVRARQLWETSDDQPSDQQRQNQRFMVTTGLMLLGLFVLFVLFLAAPAIGSSLC
jgi:cytochrome b561